MPRKSGASDGTTVPFHVVVSAQLAAGAFAFACQPSASFGTRLLAAADEWAHFRVKSLRFRAHRIAALTTPIVLGFVGGVQDTPPGTGVQVSELLSSTVQGPFDTKPSDWVVPSAAELAGPFPWYKSVPGAADPTEESPGTIVVASVNAASTETFFLEFRGVFAFKTAVSTTNTPMPMLLARRAEREAATRGRARAALLGVLTVAPSVSVLSGPSNGK